MLNALGRTGDTPSGLSCVGVSVGVGVVVAARGGADEVNASCGAGAESSAATASLPSGTLDADVTSNSCRGKRNQ